MTAACKTCPTGKTPSLAVTRVGRVLLAAAFLVFGLTSFASERVDELIRRMTPEEKCAQLGMVWGTALYMREGGGEPRLAEGLADQLKATPIGRVGALVRACWWTKKNWDNGLVPRLAPKIRNQIQRTALEATRLRIPLWFEDEAPHGMMALGAPVYPTGLGLGSTFDRDLMRRIGAAIAAQAKARGMTCVYGPILDVSRDPRWSRTEECFGEDPVLTAQLGAAEVRGLVESGVSPCLKHYVAGGMSEGGHNTASVHCGGIEFFNRQLRPFREAISAGARYVMSTYHDVDGELCTSSRYLLMDVLRGRLGFNGFVRADAYAIGRACSYRLVDSMDAAYALSLEAGCDSEDRRNTIPECGCGYLGAWRKGLLSQMALDAAVRNVLQVKEAYGLFENPYVPEDDPVLDVSPTKDELVLEAARKSLVLLSNRNKSLPLAKSRPKLAVVGPNAGEKIMNQLGDYTAPQRREDVVTVAEGLARYGEVSYARGCGIRSKRKDGFAEAIRLAAVSDVTVFVAGGSSAPYGTGSIDTTGAFLVTGKESEENDKESGEGTDRRTLGYSGVQEELFLELRKVAKKLVVVLIQGRPLVCRLFVEQADAVLMAWYPGSRGGEAVAEALFGDVNPGGRLSVSIPDSVGQVPVTQDGYLKEHRRYIDGPGEAFLPFGHGLSYTDFDYSAVTVEEVPEGTKVSVTVTNRGGCAGDEIVPFFLTAQSFGSARPWRELFAFERLTLGPGESRTVSAVANRAVRGWYDRDGHFLEPRGTYSYKAGWSR